MSNPDQEFGVYDEQEKASHVLDAALDDPSQAELSQIANQIAVEKELAKDELVHFNQSNRERTRVLIVTSNDSVLEENSLDHTFYLTLANQFDEVHIIVAASLRKVKKFTKRYGQNLWLYTTGHVSWYRAPGAIKSVAKDQLTFAEGFRPDFIVATDPFEAGLGAYQIAKKFQRPWQLHIKEKFWTPTFLQQTKGNKWRQKIANWLLKRSVSVRASTNEIKEYLATNYKKISDLGVLPRHYNIKELIAISEQSTETDLFPQASLVFLFIGHLDYKSTLFRTIDATRHALSSPRTLLVVVGDGPSKEEFKKRTEIFGINQQVLFKPETTDIVPLLQSADMFICTDTTEASDELVIKAAAVGVPLLLAKTQLREDLFTDGEDAFLCDPGDTQAFSQRVDAITSDPALRARFKSGSQYTAQTRLHEDPDVFYVAYRNTMERVFNVSSLDDAEKTAAETIEVKASVPQNLAVSEQPAT